MASIISASAVTESGNISARLRNSPLNRMRIRYALDTAWGEPVSKNAVATSSMDSAIEIVNSDVDPEGEEYQSTVPKQKIKTMNGKEFDPNDSTSKPIELKASNGTDNVIIFEQSLQFCGYFGFLLGININYDWKPNPKFYNTVFALVFLWSQVFYTQFLYIKRKEYYKLLEVFACYGVLLSMVFKLWVFLKYFKSSTALFNSTKKICKDNLSGCRAKKIRDRLQENFKFYKWTALCIILSVGIFVAYPAKVFIMDGKYLPLLPFEIMFLDQSTLSGFLTANAIMAALGIMADVATVYSIVAVVATISNYTILVDLIEEDFKSLDNMWGRESDTTVKYRRLFLKNICRKQQDMDDYIAEIKNLLDMYIFIYFCANYFGQIICLFQIVVSDWKSGYAIAYGMLLEMMFYCLMGTKLTTDNERMSSVLQQSKWYLYDQHSQKIFYINVPCKFECKRIVDWHPSTTDCLYSNGYNQKHLLVLQHNARSCLVISGSLYNFTLKEVEFWRIFWFYLVTIMKYISEILNFGRLVLHIQMQILKKSTGKNVIQKQFLHPYLH